METIATFISVFLDWYFFYHQLTTWITDGSILYLTEHIGVKLWFKLLLFAFLSSQEFFNHIDFLMKKVLTNCANHSSEADICIVCFLGLNEIVIDVQQ